MEKNHFLINHYLKLDNLKNDFRNKNLFNLILPEVGDGIILDIGCGSGVFIKLLNKSKREIIGIEPIKELVDIAKANNPNLLVLKGKADELNRLVKKKLDTVILIDVLEFIRKDDLIIKKIYKQLNEGGKLIIVVPAYQFLYGKRDKIQGHVRRYSKKRLKKILIENGFKIKRIKYWSMLGVAPYFFYEKILNKKLDTKLRNKNETVFKKVLNKMLDFWFRYIENNINLGFGLTLIVISEKK